MRAALDISVVSFYTAAFFSANMAAARLEFQCEGWATSQWGHQYLLGSRYKRGLLAFWALRYLT